MSEEITQDNMQKALQHLQDFAKGHASRGTNTTAVDAMSGESGSTQVHHTANDSDPNGWAGSTAQYSPENGAQDSIAENGTDYVAQAGMAKAILAKIGKGQDLTAVEKAFCQAGGMDILKGKNPFAKDDDDDDKDVDKACGKDDDKDMDKAHDDDDKDMDKSFTEHAKDIKSLNEGLEVSDIIRDMAKAFDATLASQEVRLRKSIVAEVVAAVSSAQAENAQYQGELAKAMSSFAEVAALQGQRIDQVETAPARGAKSAQRASVVEKSFDGAPQEEEMSKSFVLEGLLQLVMDGKATSQDVVKYETTGQIAKSLVATVAALPRG